MSSQPTPSRPAPASGSSASGSVDYASLVPLRVDSEDAFSAPRTNACWQKLYRRLNLTDEASQASLRAAVYVYLLVNGASRVGNYSGQIQTSTGLVVPAAIIPQEIGLNDIRRFARGNMIESYDMLKIFDLSHVAPRHVAKCADMGISATNAFATGDWMDACPKFTPNETSAHTTYRNFSLKRAHGARGNRNLEEIETAAMDDTLRAQGLSDQVGRRVDL